MSMIPSRSNSLRVCGNTNCVPPPGCPNHAAACDCVTPGIGWCCSRSRCKNSPICYIPKPMQGLRLQRHHLFRSGYSSINRRKYVWPIRSDPVHPRCSRGKVIKARTNAPAQNKLSAKTLMWNKVKPDNFSTFIYFGFTSINIIIYSLYGEIFKASSCSALRFSVYTSFIFCKSSSCFGNQMRLVSALGFLCLSVNS